MSGQGAIAGKSVLITGAASGIGKALAEGFLADGAKVIAADIEEGPLAPLAARGALALKADVSNPQGAASMIAKAVQWAGRLDVLFNNAGLGYMVKVADDAPDKFERMIAVNLLGPLYGMRAAIPLMRAQGFGRIVNTLSRGAETGGPGWGAYGASKAGLFALTRSAASENLDVDLLINGLIPGPTKSGMNPKAPQDPARVYPTARMLAMLPKGGPTGRVFWDEKEYFLFDPANGAFRRDIAKART